MYLKSAVVFSLIASSFATPASISKKPNKRAVLSVQDYSQFQVSSGVGGNAFAEVQANFPINEDDIANIDPEDLAIIKAAGEVAKDAETEAGGFNEAIATAGKNTTTGRALQVGKIKNKVLKLQLSVLALKADVARSRTDRGTKLQEQITKLNKSIQLDEAAAGQESQTVNFRGSSQP